MSRQEFSSVLRAASLRRLLPGKLITALQESGSDRRVSSFTPEHHGTSRKREGRRQRGRQGSRATQGVAVRQARRLVQVLGQVDLAFLSGRKGKASHAGREKVHGTSGTGTRGLEGHSGC